jgi:hypothetical protein
MNPDSHDLIQRHMAELLTDDEAAVLQTRLKADTDLRRLYLHYMNLDVALEAQAGSRGRVINLLRASPLTENKPAGRWLSWRPLTAAAAGIVFGMLCTSVVFGFVAQRAALVKKIPLAVFDPGFEDVEAPLDDGLPKRVGQWGVDSARLVPAESGVKPLESQHMLRLEPIPREKQVKNHTSRVYQLIDLRVQPQEILAGDAEVQVTASFFATRHDFNSRYLIRVIALDEPPETATTEFWSKTERDDVVSVSQRYDRLPGDGGWQTCSLKIPLPRGAKTLVFILGTLPPEDASVQASVHYLDDVQVSLLAPDAKLP